MPSLKQQRRKRYAEDAEYRKIVLGYYRRYRAAHRAEINERKRRRWATDPEFRAKILAADVKTRRARVLKRYGISEEQYERLLRLQNGVCAICKEKPEGWLCVDHCHLTGKVRGLLCKNCNSALGLYRDDPNRTEAATVYLRAFYASYPELARTIRRPQDGSTDVCSASS